MAEKTTQEGHTGLTLLGINARNAVNDLVAYTDEEVRQLDTLRTRFNELAHEHTQTRARETEWFNERAKLIEENERLKNLAANLEAQRDEKAGQVKRLVDGNKFTNAQHAQLKRDYERLDAVTAQVRANSSVLALELGNKVSALEKELAASKKEHSELFATLARSIGSGRRVTIATTVPEERLLKMHALPYEKTPKDMQPILALLRVVSGEWDTASLNQRLQLVELLVADGKLRTTVEAFRQLAKDANAGESKP